MAEYKSIISPSKYYQGEGILDEIYERTSHLGDTYALVVDQIIYDLLHDRLEKAFEGKPGKHVFIIQKGESTDAESERVAKEALDAGCHILVGIGGGKVMDTTKIASTLDPRFKVVICPTSAASDAPCSANAVVYTESGAFVRTVRPKENPSVVLVDSGVIANAPARLLVAGMGDAFVTYYEARASKRANLTNLSGGYPTETVGAVALLCRDILLQYGAKALEDVKNKRVTPELESVIEANILMSGLGFESGGLSISHATYNGLTQSIDPFPLMHGEGVAFGLMVQLAVEYLEAGEWNDEEWALITGFLGSVGLPTTFADAKLPDSSDATLKMFAENIYTSSGNSKRQPFEVTPEKIFKALQKLRDMEG